MEPRHEVFAGVCPWTSRVDVSITPSLKTPEVLANLFKCKGLDGKEVLLLTVQPVSVCSDHTNTLSTGTGDANSFLLS